MLKDIKKFYIRKNKKDFFSNNRFNYILFFVLMQKI